MYLCKICAKACTYQSYRSTLVCPEFQGEDNPSNWGQRCMSTWGQAFTRVQFLGSSVCMVLGLGAADLVLLAGTLEFVPDGNGETDRDNVIPLPLSKDNT